MVPTQICSKIDHFKMGTKWAPFRVLPALHTVRMYRFFPTNIGNHITLSQVSDWTLALRLAPRDLAAGTSDGAAEDCD